MHLPQRMVDVQLLSSAAAAAALVGTSGNFHPAGKRPALGHVAGRGFIHVPGRSLLAAFCADGHRADNARAAMVEEEKKNSRRVVFELRLRPAGKRGSMSRMRRGGGRVWGGLKFVRGVIGQHGRGARATIKTNR